MRMYIGHRTPVWLIRVIYLLQLKKKKKKKNIYIYIYIYNPMHIFIAHTNDNIRCLPPFLA